MIAQAVTGFPPDFGGQHHFLLHLLHSSGGPDGKELSVHKQIHNYVNQFCIMITNPNVTSGGLTFHNPLTPDYSDIWHPTLYGK